MRTYAQHKWVRSRRGSTFVESALVIMIVLVTLIGIVDIGQVLVLHQGLVERVRAGARYAIVNSTVDATTGAINFNSDKIKNVIRFNTSSPPTGSPPLLNLTDPSLISVQGFGGNTPEARIRIAITDYPIHFFTPGLKGPGIKGDYKARPITISMPLEGATTAAP